MKTNVTLKIETSLLKDARVLAAREGTSMSALLTKSLEREVRKDKEYEQARRSALAMLKAGFSLGWTPPRSRDEIYER